MLEDVFQADELNAMKGLNYDLLDKYWKSALTQQHSVNLSGATEKAMKSLKRSHLTDILIAKQITIPIWVTS